MVRQRHIQWYWLIGVWLWLVTPVYAQAPINLYQAAVPVIDRGAHARDQAIQQALIAVLVKVSGNLEVASVPQVNAQLSKANKWVQQYRYQSKKNQPLQLQVQFNQKSVNTLLTTAGQAVWPNQRPKIAVWLSVVSGDDRLIIVDDKSPTSAMTKIVNLFHHVAEKRGIPIMLPPATLLQQSNLSFADVYSLSQASLLPTLTTLHADALLIGRMVRRGERMWQANWTFVLNDDVMQWQTQGSDVQVAFSKVISDVADSLTQRFAILPDPTTAQSVTLAIEHVNDPKTYAKVIHYLTKLPLVTHVDVLAVDGDTLTVGLTTTGGQQALQQAVNFGHVLIPTTPSAAMGNTMRYRVGS